MSERDDEAPESPGRDGAEAGEPREGGDAAGGESSPSPAESAEGGDAAGGGEATVSGELEAASPASSEDRAHGGGAAPGAEAADEGAPEATRTRDPDVPPWADDLPALAGVRPRRHLGDEEEGEPRRPRRKLSPRALAYTLGGIAAAGFAIFLVVASWANSDGYYLVCETDSIRAERGRWLPWGHASMDGPKWEPIPISADTECADVDVATESALAERFTRALLDRAGEILASGEDEALEDAERQLEQAMLLTRGPEGRAAREEVVRLRGDLAYRRAAGELDTALEQLSAAAETFAEAAERNPRHHEDAGAWAAHVQNALEALRTGPGTPISRPAPTGPEDGPGGAATTPQTGASSEAPIFGPKPPAPAERADPQAESAPGADDSPPIEEDLPQGGVLL